MEAQVENAIDIAFSPASNADLRSQALDFVSQLRTDPSGWQVCLSLFTRTPPPSEVVRHVSLETISNAIQTQRLDQQSLEYTRDSLRAYIQGRYNTAGVADASALQNKLTQTITYLFTSLYATSWSSFFDDFREIAGGASQLGVVNPPGTIFYLRVLRSVHDEIADVLIARSQDEARRNTELKDLVRERDAAKIAASWQQILARWREIDLDIVQICLTCVGRWISWTDIALVVNPEMLQSLWDLAGQQGVASESAQGGVRNAAINALSEIVAKKMPPSDKIELISFLNISEVLTQLIATPGLSEYRSTSQYDTDLGEIVARLTNAAYFDIVKTLDTDNINDATRAKADEHLQNITPFVLRFFADEYDEICSTVIPSLTDLLTMFRRKAKAGTLPPAYSQALPPILNCIISKMKYDETANWGEDDDRTDEAEFQELRKRLHVLQQTVAAVDENLFMETVSGLVGRTFDGLDAGNQGITWREADLALHEIFLFGELAVKHGGLYAKGVPATNAGHHLVAMMSKMVESNIAEHPHPVIQLQYLEICVRYCSFFEHNIKYTGKALATFVRFVHSEHPKVRVRSWYLFFRFVKQLRQHLGSDADTVLQSFGDLLQIRAEVPEEDADDDSSSDGQQSSSAIFDGQLYLFEAIGAIASTHSTPLSKQTFYARSVLQPLLADLQAHLPSAAGGSEQAILQVHHIIMAAGTLARGFCDWMPGVSSAGAPPATELSAEFEPASQAILSALETLSTSSHIREAARYAFTRMLGVVGARILQQLPRWLDGLLTQSASKEEISTFLRLIDQVIFGFKTEIASILDSLLTPLLQRIYSGLSEPTSGTDDEIQLAELKTQYLQFLLVMLNNDLASILVSPTNQGNFEPLLASLEHFIVSGSGAEYNTAKLSFSVLQHMVSTWGGPDLALPGVKGSTSVGSNAANNNNSSANAASSQADATNGTAAVEERPTQPAPLLPGFDKFASSRFSPLVWKMVSSPTFAAKDAQARQALLEAGGLQWVMLRKCGLGYEAYLRDEELKGLGLGQGQVEEYLARLRGEAREWRRWFAGFVGHGAS